MGGSEAIALEGLLAGFGEGSSYAGIGSRSTPGPVLRLMRRLAGRLAEQGAVLRTGGAGGADQAFLEGARTAPGEVELYLPWRGFRGLSGETLSEPSRGGLWLAEQVHPAWARCSRAARALHGRNSHQVLGVEIGEPATAVVCWTPDGSLDGASRRAGGTGQALRIAAMFEVPVLNLARPDHMALVTSYLAHV